MPVELFLALGALFIGVAVTSGAVASTLMARRAPERRRLDRLTTTSGVVLDAPLTDVASPVLKRLSRFVPKSPKEMSLLRRRLTAAGYRSIDAVIVFSVAKLAIPPIVALAAFSIVAVIGVRGLILVGFLGFAGFMIPDFYLSRLTKRRQKVIRNGLPDALDLFIVCLEAGSSLDQAILKASDELEIAYPALADELKLITTEIRAGKPRLEAFKNFAERTRVDDVRALVAMLVQTDRFGTSVSQALRTHADQARTKRRQVAEEKAAKLSVKLVIPLVFLLFPALYVVILGPAWIKIMRVFGTVLNR